MNNDAVKMPRMTRKIVSPIGNESLPKIITNDTDIFF